MKLCGEFVVRQVVDSIVAIPVGQTALRLNGMILLNDVSKIIWDCLEQGTTLESAVKAVTDVFEALWDNGGCIAQCEFGAGAKPENVEAVFRTWDKLTSGR